MFEKSNKTRFRSLFGTQKVSTRSASNRTKSPDDIEQTQMCVSVCGKWVRFMKRIVKQFDGTLCESFGQLSWKRGGKYNLSFFERSMRASLLLAMELELKIHTRNTRHSLCF